jgi:hypothetical protein
MREKGFIEVGGEFDKYVRGKWEPEKLGPLCTVEEVAEKLKEVQHRMAHDPVYRRYYEGQVRNGNA